MKFFKNFFDRFKDVFLNKTKLFQQFLLRQARNNLWGKKIYQKKNFAYLKQNFANLYNNLKDYRIDKYLVDYYQEVIKQLESKILPYPPFSFLRNHMIRYIMFISSGGKWLKIELNYLEKSVSKKILKTLLIEDYVGLPILLNYKYKTSHNTIHHLFHIIKFLEITKTDLKSVNTIIEWGGGYGNMAKLFQKLTENEITYIIIDIPIMCCIQWIYLSTIFSSEKINLIDNINGSIKNNLINILPICFLENFNLNADLFISTWALSESSKFSQDYVVKHNWFNSNNILLAYQDINEVISESNRIKIYSKNFGLHTEKINFLPGSYYLMR